MGNSRLAILDLDARAHRPMVPNGGRDTTVFNDEIAAIHTQCGIAQ